MKQAPSGAFGILLAAVIALGLVWMGWFFANEGLFPPNSLPWKAVQLDQPPNWIARWQLNNLKGQGEACRMALAGASQLKVTPVADRKIDGACGFTNVVRTDAAPAAFSPSVTATCALTAALYWYQRQMDAVARAHMHAPLTGITQLGTFACRNVNNEQDGNRSEHATANAIDVAGFRFADGRTVSVARDYGKNSDEGRFLDAAHAQACKLFNGVLGPRYNTLHANHFHLDMGPYHICA